MRLNQVKLTNIRGIQNAEIDFSPGFNLIIGENGAGKTTVIEAIRTLLAQSLPQFVGTPTNTLSFSSDDVMRGSSSGIVEIAGECFGKSFTYSVNIVSENGDLRLDKHSTGMPAKRVTTGNRPLVIFFSTRRAASTNSKERVEKKYPEYSECFFAKRTFKVADFKNWWKATNSSAIENPSSKSKGKLDVLSRTLGTLLPDFEKWRIDGDDLWVDKKTEKIILNEKTGAFDSHLISLPIRIEELSDGEKNLAIIGLELSRRMTALNPDSENPCEEGDGVVLIDELDLHLHPRWQRRIIKDLQRTFPRVQFICTTHSPQLIGQLPSDKISILGLNETKQRPPQSFGMDSNWILRNIMESDDRDPGIASELDKIFEEIEAGDFESAQRHINNLRGKVGEHPDMVEAQALVSRYSRFSESNGE